MTVRGAERELTLRIVLLGPPAGVGFCVQVASDGLLPPARESADGITFEVRVRVVELDGGAFTLRGQVAQGPPAARFVYVNSGRHAGQPDSPWDRRAKVPLAGITRVLVDEALARPGAVLETRFAGSDSCGAPVCATVRPAVQWRVVRSAE